MMRLAAALAVLSLAATATAYRLDALADPRQVVLSGSAALGVVGIDLTPDVTYRAGSAFSACPVRFGPDASFKATFVVLIDGEQGTHGADGIAFVVQAGPTGAGALGGVGGSLAFAGVAPGVGLELDTHKNENDPSDNHVGLLSSAAPGKHLAVGEAGVDLNGGKPILVLVAWDATSRMVSVSLGDHAEPTLVAPLDLETVVGRTGYLGLVAATGALRNAHHVLSWVVEIGGQTDTDGDGLLDDCDGDDDGDGLPDGSDVCPLVADPGQADRDGDGTGDACDDEPDDGAGADPDRDGLSNAEEKAAGTDPSNPDSDEDTILDGDEAVGGRDTDGDGFADPLDSDADGDGVLDLAEAGDAELGTAPVDTDGDGAPDFLDLDSDQDGVPDKLDRCRTVADPDQTDADGDGVGDACVGFAPEARVGSVAAPDAPAMERPAQRPPSDARPPAPSGPAGTEVLERPPAPVASAREGTTEADEQRPPPPHAGDLEAPTPVLPSPSHDDVEETSGRAPERDRPSARTSARGEEPGEAPEGASRAHVIEDEEDEDEATPPTSSALPLALGVSAALALVWVVARRRARR